MNRNEFSYNGGFEPARPSPTVAMGNQIKLNVTLKKSYEGEVDYKKLMIMTTRKFK